MLSLIFAAIEVEDDREFMEGFYDEHHRFMFSIARNYTEDPYSCEEIVQESLLNLIKVCSLLRTRAPHALVSYLRTTVRNTACNYLKKEARLRKRVFSLEQIPHFEPEDQGLSMDELLIWQENQGKLSDIWSQLPEEDQFLLSGKYILNATDAELAAALGCKASSIRMKMTRARRKALKLLEERMEKGETV